MKKFIYAMTNNIALVLFALFGLALLIFPQHLVKVVLTIRGGVLILFGLLNLYASLHEHGENSHPGSTLIYFAAGIAAIIQKEAPLVTVGIVWAMLILMECAEEIDEVLHSREIHPIPLIWTAVSVVLAVMLLSDPAEHFVFHMRILGLEAIAYAGICFWKRRNA